MVVRQKAWNMENSTTISSGGYWYPLSESTAPTNLDLDQNTPFKALIFENHSGEDYKVIIDPTPVSSTKEFFVPNGKTLVLESRENINFHQVICYNNSSISTDTNELKLQLRNY